MLRWCAGNAWESSGDARAILRRCSGDAQAMLGRCSGDARVMLGRCTGHDRAMLGRCSGDTRAMLGRYSGDDLIRTIGTIRSILRAKSDLFESLGRLRSREYLEPCLICEKIPQKCCCFLLKVKSSHFFFRNFKLDAIHLFSSETANCWISKLGVFF